MVIDISRGHIKVKVGEKIATLEGEMFFPGNDKMGFVLYRDSIKRWDNQDQTISPTEVEAIINEIQLDFAKGGHILELE